MAHNTTPRCSQPLHARARTHASLHTHTHTHLCVAQTAHLRAVERKKNIVLSDASIYSRTFAGRYGFDTDNAAGQHIKVESNRRRIHHGSCAFNAL